MKFNQNKINKNDSFTSDAYEIAIDHTQKEVDVQLNPLHCKMDKDDSNNTNTQRVEPEQSADL